MQRHQFIILISATFIFEYLNISDYFNNQKTDFSITLSKYPIK